MSFFGWANRGIESTQRGLSANPTTGTLIAEVDVNGSNASVIAGGQVWGVTWIVGNLTTVATFLLDHALSTSISDTGIINQTVVVMSSGNSAQFYTKHNLESTNANRFRVRVGSSFTGSVSAKIIAEPLV